MKPTTTPTLHRASLGTVSHGTLRTEDLLSAFLCELESQMLANGAYFSDPANFSERDKLCNLIGYTQDAWSEDGETIRKDMDGTPEELVEDLADALTIFAPPYCYFGAHEGDGSDYGFWPSWSEIEELPCITDNSAEAISAEQSPDYSTDVRYVNDHGNTTVFGADGSVLLELV